MTLDKNSNFFLGRIYDPAQGKTSDQPLLYDPAALTTHAVVTGMTGSGKTGLCIAILEEAALHGVPAIIVDPKGDLTNLVLHFPELAGKDFEPWLDPDLAARSGKSLPALAEETAARWKDGLAGWGLGPDDLRALQQQGRYTIYTPGSSAGISVNILNSFQSPGIPWEENREVLREKIASVVTAVLGLVGLQDIDPLRSREHILLSNILESAWSQQKPLDLTELILQTQTPPFQRLGAFPVDSFFPRKDRMDLAMLLNNFLAAPSFQTWQEGQPLDIPALLYTPEGKPRQSIFYLASLSDSERMFFVSLLFSAVETWMRTQRGTGGLRALLYFDEILGYLPPTHNPPSKPILLRMLKQARAFGVGLLLATQNPVDLDYKALSNAGTWMIGRLQTDQDKQRLLDGLTSASGDVDAAVYNRMISGLQKRIFLMHSTAQSEPTLFQSRWTLNFLAGPLTRAQVPDLNRLAMAPFLPPPAPVAPTLTVPDPAATRPVAPVAGAIPNGKPTAVPLPVVPVQARPPVQPLPSAPRPGTGYLSTRPAMGGGVAEYFVQAELGLSQAAEAANIGLSAAVEPEGIIYRPALLAQAGVRYLAARYNVEMQRSPTALVSELPGSLLHWEEVAWAPFKPGQLAAQPLPQTRFCELPEWLGDARRMNALERDFLDWVYRTGTIHLHANLSLKQYAPPSKTLVEFREQCSQVAHDASRAETDQIAAGYEKKLGVVQAKLAHLKTAEKDQKEEVDQRKMEELGANGQFFLSLFSKRKKSLNTSLTKRRMAEQAKSDLDDIRSQMSELEDQAAGLEKERDAAVAEARERWAKAVIDFSDIPLAPQKKDIYLEYFGVAWRPYYLVKVGEDLHEIPAYPVR